MAESPPPAPWHELLRPLAGPTRAWLVDASSFEQHVRSVLPPKHELRSLLDHARGKLAEQRSARAYDRLCNAPLPDALSGAVHALWLELGPSLERGLTVEPRWAIDDERGADAGAKAIPRLLPAVHDVHGPDATCAAILCCWSRAVLHAVVVELAQLGVRKAALVVVLRDAVDEPAAQATSELELPSELPEGSRRGAVAAEPDEPARRSPRAEIVLGAGAEEPLTASSRSMAGQLWAEAAAACLGALGCSPPRAEGWIRATAAGAAVDLSALALTLAAAPARGAELVLLGLGGTSERTLAGLVPVRGNAGLGLRGSRIALAATRSALGLAPEIVRRERRLGPELAALGELDLGLLPNDGLPTTIDHALGLLRQAATLWSRALGAEIAVQAALGAVVRHRLPAASSKVGTMLARGGGGASGAAWAVELEALAGQVRADRRAAALLRAGGLRQLEDLPNGRARTAVETFLAGHADLALAPFELARSRWGEEASELGRMLTLLLDAPPPATTAAELRGRARADAEAELAAYEPSLSLLERGLARALRDRARAMARRRCELDRLVLRALGVTRRALLDADRRLRRIDPENPVGAGWHCGVAELQRALIAELPDIGPLVRMRMAERRLALPPSVEAEQPHHTSEHELEGVGASPGLGEGPARLGCGPLPASFAPGQVWVLRHADPAASPLYLGAAALVVETGGLFTPAAETARELGVPMVTSVAHACSLLREGELLRVDGTRGTVERLGRP